MAENTSKTEPKTDNPTAPSTDAQAGAKVGLTEGEVKALRDDAGVNTLAGHEANLVAWEQTDAAKEFIKDSKEQAKKDEAAAKATRESLDKDGLSEADKKYREALSK